MGQLPGSQSRSLRIKRGQNGENKKGEVMEAYCMKCKTNREMQNPVRVYMKNGKPRILGRCSTCNSRLSRFVGVQQLEGARPPVNPKGATPQDSE
jgi:hypothetical protein